MTEPPKPRTPHAASYIPVVAPRPMRSPLPSSLSLPQLQLAPQPRRPSGSSPAVAASPVSSSIPHTGISSFRSLRNLLPFGAAKSHHSAGATGGTPNVPKSSFPNFGSVRRSMTSDRKNSATFTRAEEEDPSPVISIEASPQHTDTDTDYDTLAYDSRSSSGDHINFSPASRKSSDTKPPAPAVSPAPPLGDLSTIVESDTSGISKHLPNLDDSQELELKAGKHGSSARHAQYNYVGRNASSMECPNNQCIDLDSDAYTLDLSTSKLTAEVLDAMISKDVSTANEWWKGVNGVVVDDVTDSPPKIGGFVHGEQDNNLSFNFGSLDPDLAALLSPNKADENAPTVFGGKPLLAPSLPIRSPPSPRGFELPPSRGLTRTASPRSFSPPAVQPPDGYFASASYLTDVQSSPAPRRSASLARSTPSHRPVSLSTLPRLARLVTSTAAPVQPPKHLTEPGPPSPHSSPEVDESGRRASSDHIRRRQPPSPLSSSSHAVETNHGALDLYTQRQSRLVTPARRAASYSTASSSRPPLRHLMTTGLNPKDPDLTTSFSRVSSSVGKTATSRRRLYHLRPNTDEGRTVTDPDRTVQHRARKRSMSLHQDGGSPGSNSPYQTPAPPTRPSSAMSARRPAAEWLGPRTAKAFAAAGLLDHEKAGWGNNNTSSHYGSMKGNTEQDPRAQYNAPSRIAFSEASGSTSSWGRSRSVSRTLTMSDIGGALTESPTYSPTPRTTFSGGSTAPTSISASSSITQSSLQVAVQSMREKHSVETEALLSALSDSQRTSKMLREENAELRARIQELEGTLNHIRRRSSSPQPPAKLSRMVYQRLSQSSLESGLPMRPQSHMQTQFLHPDVDVVPVSVTSERDTSPNPFKDTPSSQRRRLSTASSNFHLPPSNMSMLMHEVDLPQRSEEFSSRSVSPRSPTLIIAKRSSSLRHTQNRSMSSGGNISPMTANFSTGSPGSLHLRPEHELHLGDMASLDLAMADDGGSDDDSL
ncbi:hypothetical protein PILCRDRAFT_827933 [Piloderma croceum F 1598]|uniref:Uncharacterized protein n=1 Tax=Piloderma croceum (strain F 1598) TaxID=765440 RepID=A0A0C3EQA0_PILCF|nr:hypothetical protein PILCRDRAFT_827933 [Piloderma croceum F 1598]